MVNDFIFELGCEELPSGHVWPLADALATQVLAALDKAQLHYGMVKRYASPRRLAMIINDVQTVQPSQLSVRKGPALAAAFNTEGQPTPALLGFAKSCGVEVSQLTRVNTDKGEWLVYESQSTSVDTQTLLPGIIQQALKSLPITKPMRWGCGEEEFVRPVHWALMMFGENVLTHSFFGVNSSNKSYGHRFHHPQELTIHSAKQYESQLKEAWVIADFAARRQLIKQQVEQLAEGLHAVAIMPEDLLDEVCSIVEWPQALLAQFENKFLEVPAEALIASMQVHQKCFALRNQSGQLLPYFITVANINSTNKQQLIAGNEKVMRARLSDAAFFYQQDKKSKLSDHLAATKQVVFQNKLGSLYDKVLRLQAMMVQVSIELKIPTELAQRAALLSKCDLMTGMVGEFPELQGLMGYYYALHDKEDELLAKAIHEQYLPRFANDELPQSDLGLALSLVDRIDTLVGIFAIGQKPSGLKDPFKLRRHALAVVRLLISTPSAISLNHLIDDATLHFGALIKDKTPLLELKSFILERLNSHYVSQGIASELITAVRARQDDWLYDFDKRVQAIQSFISLPEAASLSAACKRVNNLLAQAALDDFSIQEALLEENAEKILYEQINQMINRVDPLYAAADYSALLKQLANLKHPLDQFFDEVMVMVDNKALKRNRLAILFKLQQLLQGVADISLLQL